MRIIFFAIASLTLAPAIALPEPAGFDLLWDEDLQAYDWGLWNPTEPSLWDTISHHYQEGPTEPATDTTQHRQKSPQQIQPSSSGNILPTPEESGREGLMGQLGGMPGFSSTSHSPLAGDERLAKPGQSQSHSYVASDQAPFSSSQPKEKEAVGSGAQPSSVPPYSTLINAGVGATTHGSRAGKHREQRYSPYPFVGKPPIDSQQPSTSENQLSTSKQPPARKGKGGRARKPRRKPRLTIQMPDLTSEEMETPEGTKQMLNYLWKKYLQPYKWKCKVIKGFVVSYRTRGRGCTRWMGFIPIDGQRCHQRFHSALPDMPQEIEPDRDIHCFSWEASLVLDEHQIADLISKL